MEDGLPLRERAAASVFAGHADGGAFEQQGAESQALGHRPIQRLRALGHLRAPGQLLHHLRVQAESGGHGRHSTPDPPEDAGGHARDDLGRGRCIGLSGLLGLSGLPRRRDGGRRPAPGLLGGDQSRLVEGHLPGLDHLRLLLREDVVPHEPPRVQRAHARVLLNAPVHQRLRVGGFVALAVPVQAEAEQVHDDVLAELLPVVERD